MMKVNQAGCSFLTKWSTAFMSLHAAAEGCFTPFIAIYFRQLGLSSSKIGFLLGVRILTGTFFCLFWRHFARKFNKLKVLLVCSVFAAILFRVALSFIPPVSSEFLLEYCADSNHSSSQAKQNHSTTSFDNPPIARSGSLDAEFLSRSLHHPEMSNVKLHSQRRNDDKVDSKTNDSISSSSSIFFITFIVVLFGEMFASSAVHVVRASLYHHLDDTDNLSFFPVAVTICSLSYGISAVAVSERTAPPGLFHPLFVHSESFSALGAVLGYMTSGLLGRIIRFKIVFVVFGIFAASWGAVSLVMMHYFPKKETIQYAQLFRSEGDSGDGDSTSEDWLEKALDEDEEF
ncbi:Phosphoinositide 3-kinase regulatory subunit 6 [Apostichopus japonicus]|uniref:Phosphoinositide 3-kinase regulatory subunit 6 n=1 Tax=Stichopus japonicus TaxID=307972 RepID=A0A2G8JCI8_STIJA|nr:Phosphoinositide 3-kinase regulatory subunit 6 [Apostichopus japonicus]